MTFKELAKHTGHSTVKAMCEEIGVKHQTLERIRSRDDDAGVKEDLKCKELILLAYDISSEDLLKLVELRDNLKAFSDPRIYKL